MFSENRPALFLAPLAGITDSAFRQTCKEYGADYTVSDLLNTTLELDRRNTAALLDYYELLTLRNSVNRVT